VGVSFTDAELSHLPEDTKSLQAMIGSLLRERGDLRVENLRLQVELERYKKRYYGQRADRLADSGDVAQMLLQFAEGLERKAVNPDDLPPHTEPEEELRRGEAPPWAATSGELRKSGSVALTFRTTSCRG
jgi:hypothetical protein